MRITSRTIGVILVSFWVLMGVGYGVGGGESFSWESFGITVLIICNAIGLIIAWKNEKVGGWVLAITGIAFGIFAHVTAGRNELYAVAVSGLPFFIVGILFLCLNRITEKK